MHQALRPYVTAGIAVVGAGVIAVTPVAAPLPELHAHDVALTSGLDLTTAWTDVFSTAEANVSALQAGVADAQAALHDAISGNADWAKTNPQEILDALTFLGGDQKNFIDPLDTWTLSDGLTGHEILFDALTGQLASFNVFPTPSAEIQDLVNFLSSPLSGVLIGELGPAIAPMVALDNSIQAIIGDLSGATPNVTQALQDLVNIPANMLGGLLNGATLDLKDLVPAIESANIIPLPSGVAINDVSIAFGGLLSPGLVTGITPEGQTTGGDYVGGSIFNALGLNLSGVPVVGSMNVDPEAVGPMGAWLGLEQIIANVFSGSGLTWTAPASSAAAEALSGGGFDQMLTDLFSGDGLSSLGL